MVYFMDLKARAAEYKSTREVNAGKVATILSFYMCCFHRIEKPFTLILLRLLKVTQ